MTNEKITNINSSIEKAIKELNKRDISEMNLVYKEKFLTKLNHEQRVAATRKEGNFLVIAGPGSGKTHTLAYRVIYLVKNNVDPQSIVVITFTRKAGKELKERISSLLPNTSLGFIGTFHGFSNFISTKLGNSSPISGFRLLDTEDDVQVHKLVMADFKSFVKKIKPKQIQKLISYCYNTELSISEYITKFDVHEFKADTKNIEEYVNEYEHFKATHLLSNYDDMIRLVTKYLKGNSKTKITSSFEYLMVDEYQDTNQMQLDFIKNLKIDNVMAIGDDFQGIYGFRGADHKIILNFLNDFEKAKMIKLKENYRSTGEIVNFINKTVERSTQGYFKEFRVVKKDKGTAKVVSGKSLDEHKDFILTNIKDNTEETHALIYRYNKNRTVFEKALIEESIEYSVYGGIRLLERKHIKDIMAFLMVYLNRLDVVSFNRILIMLPGIGPKTSKKLMKSNLDDIRFMSNSNRGYLLELKKILNSKENKEELFKNICDYYFSIYEYVESETYKKEDIKDDFRLVRELLESYTSLHNFIINLILDPVIDMHKGKRPKVILTTIHSAKGLEFDNVYYFHTHDWYKNYDIESLEENRRLLYVGISRAKKNLYVFDHTGYSRSFNEILKDFDNKDIILANQNLVYESKPVKKHVNDKKTNEVSYEIINEEKYEIYNPSLKHQNSLSVIASKFYMYFINTNCKSILGPNKIKISFDNKVNIIQPDLFVILNTENIKNNQYEGVPELIVEVISNETRNVDMTIKMDLYKNIGIKEYWGVDLESKLIMVFNFENKKIINTNIFLKNQQVKSNNFDLLDIDINSIFIEE